MNLVLHHRLPRSSFSIVTIFLICACSVLTFTRLVSDTAALRRTNVERWSKPQVKLFKIVIGTTARSFRVYDGFHVFLVSGQNYTWGGQMYARTCDEWVDKCQMQDWMTMMKLVLETKVFEKADYIWILEDDTYPCPGADTLLKQILIGNPAIRMLNTGIGASGWVLPESTFQEIFDSFLNNTPGAPDVGVAENMPSLPTRLATNLITHTTIQKSILGHVHSSPIYAGCFEYQMVSGWCDYDLFNWNLCAGYDLYPCPEGTTKILSEQNIGYVGNTYTVRKGSEGLETWMSKSRVNGASYLHSEALSTFRAPSLNT
ncbi:unnamed protein product [Calypogeia fissa]